MYTPIVRILLIIFSIAMSIYFYSRGDMVNTFLPLIGAILFAYGYFKSGTMYIAFQALKKGNFEKAETLISKIKHPDRLSKGQKSYYHFSVGAIAANNKDWDTSYTELNHALQIGLRTKNDTSIVLLNIANAEYERGNLEEAEAYITKVKTFDLQPLVQSETENLEKKIKDAKNSQEHQA